MTVYYLDNPKQFVTKNVVSSSIFDAPRYRGRTDIELVLDEATDYFLLDKIFSELPEERTDIRSVIKYVDEHELSDTVVDIARRTREHTEDNDAA